MVVVVMEVSKVGMEGAAAVLADVKVAKPATLVAVMDTCQEIALRVRNATTVEKLAI
jgi:hypothetical protein